MPFSAFLTINFDARLRVEPTATAVRAIHWIAIRGLLGTFALCEDLPREDGQRRVRDHLTLVVIVLDATSEQVPPEELKAHRRLIGEVKAGMVVLTGTAGGAFDRFRASTAAGRILRRY
ncbi:hypothetical protein [Curtobacterium sp. MCLR17_042]|uniref:hypothetical protein n=1 Tax=Curtobacterium sp. MCLR17_042 TaxID=2175626 RepID=UPI000DA79E3F|nr:hypothetical protein [Curtobacterium sp. MCLR17_042]PZE28380.1 hypothetical protein DEJ02_07915 [Curtobacterium sp. MCLR17_042]